MKILLLLLTLIIPEAVSAQTDGTLTKIGQPAPDFEFQITPGKTEKLSNYKGKLVLINLFATWCPPCNTELPEMQARIWNKHKDNPDFALFVFGREENWDKLNPYKKQRGFTFPILPDADRGIFSKFAMQSIPRNILVDASGRIIYQSIGYRPDEFNKLVSLIDRELQQTAKTK